MAARGSVVGRARVVLDVDKRRYERDMMEAERSAHRTGRALKSALHAGAIGATAALTGIGVAAFKATKDASNLGEQVNKTRAVFGPAAREVQAFGRTAADSFGISNRAALEATGTFGNMLVPMGFAREGAAKMSVSMVKLAADLASFNNASPEETLDALRAGVAGESEPLRRFGVFLNDARIKEEALSMHLYKGKGAIDAKAKATAIYSLILKDTKDAQGDFGRTSDSLANQARILNARIENLSEKFGESLLPALTAVAGALLRVIDFTGRHSTAVKIAAGVVASLSAVLLVASGVWKVYAAAQAIAGVVTTETNAALVAQRVLLATSIVGALILLGTALVIAYKKSETFQRIVNAAFTAVRDVAVNVLDKISGAVAGLSKLFKSVTSFILGLVERVLGSLASVFEALDNKVTRKLIPGIHAAAKKIRSAADAVKELHDEVNKKPLKLNVELTFTGRGLVKTDANRKDGLVGAIGDGARAWARENPAALMPPMASATGSAAGLKPMILDELAIGRQMGLGLSSGYRPGSVTSSGNQSLHSVGQAIDMTGSDAQMRSFARAVAPRRGIAEVIYSPIGWSHGGSGFSPVTDATIKANHYSHVHVGARSGDGLVGAINRFAGDGDGKKRRERKAEKRARGAEELPVDIRLAIAQAKLGNDDKALLDALRRAEIWYRRHVGITKDPELKIRLIDALAGVRGEIASLQGKGPGSELPSELEEAIFLAEDTPGTEDDVTALEQAEQYLLGQLALASSAEQRLPIRQALRGVRSRLTEARGQTAAGRSATEAPLAEQALRGLDREFGGNLIPIGGASGDGRGGGGGGGDRPGGGAGGAQVVVNQNFSKPPDDPHPLLRSAKFAAEAVMG